MTTEQTLLDTIEQLRKELADLREHVHPVLELEKLSPNEFMGIMSHAFHRVGELEDEKFDKKASE